MIFWQRNILNIMGNWVVNNRKERKYPKRIMVLRFFWIFGALAFRFSFRTWFKYRNFILSIFGARIDRGAHIYRTVRIFAPWNLCVGELSSIGDNVTLYNLGRLKIGRNVTISYGSNICGGKHDLKQFHRPLIKSSISIGNDTWIGSEAFVGPGVTIGENCIISARCVIFRSVESDQKIRFQ